MVWRKVCKGCDEDIDEYVTYHQEGNDKWVAYCYECDRKDPFTYDERGKAHWTLRVRCAWEFSCGSQCRRTIQSCRYKGSSLQPLCLRWWGWCQNGKAQWHCPEHSRHLMVREIKPTECECTRKYPKPNRGFPVVATPPGGAAPPAGPREFAEEAE